VDADQELIALGMSNAGAGLFQSFPVGVSLSRSAANDSPAPMPSAWLHCGSAAGGDGCDCEIMGQVAAVKGTAGDFSHRFAAKKSGVCCMKVRQASPFNAWPWPAYSK
jgi:hypothetical protein